jgi:hypothetical protein
LLHVNGTIVQPQLYADVPKHTPLKRSTSLGGILFTIQSEFIIVTKPNFIQTFTSTFHCIFTRVFNWIVIPQLEFGLVHIAVGSSISVSNPIPERTITTMARTSNLWRLKGLVVLHHGAEQITNELPREGEGLCVQDNDPWQQQVTAPFFVVVAVVVQKKCRNAFSIQIWQFENSCETPPSDQKKRPAVYFF